uniref:RNA helicase n=1 Tax=Lates calcarifer TaxID=8187 RepID=A0A4W6DDE0_LATCA
EAYKIKVHFYCDHAGFFEQLLVFKFETGLQTSVKFEIMRLIEVIHLTSFSEELLHAATNSLCDFQTVTLTSRESHMLSGQEIQYSDVITSPVCCSCRSDPLFHAFLCHWDLCRDLQKNSLNWKNYSQRFHLLLHLEELQLKTDIEQYHKDDVPMFRYKNNTDLLVLRIPGVSPKLPKNQILVFPLDRSGLENKYYQGWVHHVDTEQVYAKFSEKFLSSFNEGKRFRVTFSINRMPLCMQHRAAALVYKHSLKEVFSHMIPLLICLTVVRLSGLENNPEQCKAIHHIVARSAKPAPYLVFGPPGTGKTVTLVEAIKQIIKTQDSCTILACAPSNSATDHLCEKILEGRIGKCKLYRLYAQSCPVKNIPENIKLCCNLNLESNTLMIPPKEELMKYKIMVTTLITAGRLVTEGVPPDHYTYIFVDEAGQATETECIIPIAGLLTPQRCQVVLAGDPKQLGPIITSRIAEKHGMGVSLLERLMRDIDLYKSRDIYGFNNRFVTKLLRNYSSLMSALPHFSLSQFILQMGTPGFPVIFHGVAGTIERDDNNPSVYNTAEVQVLKEYLKSLVEHLHKKGVTKIEPGEIGIISPYRKQVEMIQNALQMDKDLRKENLENVGSVEQFQSKEFNVILVSAVRSNPKLTAQKQRFTLGFITNEKRFNVMMTRARSLLVVVGDPRVLKTDHMWNKFIHYCSKEGAYRGITVSDAEKEDTALTPVHSLTLRVIQHHLDPWWRNLQTEHTDLVLQHLTSKRVRIKN